MKHLPHFLVCRRDVWGMAKQLFVASPEIIEIVVGIETLGFCSLRIYLVNLILEETSCRVIHTSSM